MSNSENAYQRYITDGPDSLTLDEVREALAFPEREPEAALNVRLRVEADKREARSEEMARQTWVRQGGDASEFQRAYKELSAQRRREAMAAAESEARNASLRSMLRGI